MQGCSARAGPRAAQGAGVGAESVSHENKVDF